MTNKEVSAFCELPDRDDSLTRLELQNLPPLSSNDSTHRNNDQRTPPGNAPGTLGLRPWNSSPFAPSPFRGLSPNNKPLLSAQRDHSACRLTDIPLRVRKTRENLRQEHEYADIPPPCVHAHRMPNSLDLTARRQEAARGEHSTPTQRSKYGDNGPEASASSLHLPAISTSPVLSATATTSPLKMPLKMQRHKSVSRRMLSRVKQSIGQRQKSSQSIRPIESEISLIRRLSGKRQPSIELERRTQSLEVGRDVDHFNDGIEALGSYYGASRSFTDSTTSTTELLGASRSFTPPLPSMNFDYEPTTPRLVSSSTTSVASHTSSQDPTPRPTQKKLPLPPKGVSPDAQLSLPYVDLSVNVDCACADANSQVSVWIAISASIHLKDIAIPYGTDTHDRLVSMSDHIKDAVFGQITSLKLCFKPTDDCRLLDIVGQKALKNPRPSRSCSIFVKVLIPAIVAKSTQRDNDQDSLFTELESIVGTLETELLSVEARYRHSLFPQDNIITVRQLAKVNRAKTNSRWSIVDSEKQLAASSAVHSRLAGYLAQHYPAARALELIERCLGAQGLEQDEVRRIYQDLTEYGGVDQTADASTPAVVVTDIDLGSSIASAPFSTAPCTPVNDPPIWMTSNTTGTTASLSTQNACATFRTGDKSSDEARALWRNLRHSSLTAAQLAELSTPDRLEQLEAHDESLQELRRRALANKRSIGAETLKGWKWEGVAGTPDSETPWR